jgi:hypothetical protein
VKRYSDKEILSEINNGRVDILVYLSEKYFSPARRILRMRGFHDADTPEIFSDVLFTCYKKLREHKTGQLNFENFFMEQLDQEIRNRKTGAQGVKKTPTVPAAIIAQCVTILDEQAQGLLFARVSEGLSDEQIADKFLFSNAVIAQYEVNKAFNQLEGIVKVRLNIPQH